MTPAHGITIESSPKRVRVIFNAKTVVDLLGALLLLETGKFPIYYFPREDVRMDLLRETGHRTECPYKGEASHWNLRVGDRTAENAAWTYERPLPAAGRIKDFIAFEWKKVDHWFEEDEEIFGHPRHPHHRVDVRPSSREVHVVAKGRTIARTRRAMFLFETGLPTRYHIPASDIQMHYLVPSGTKSICPYKGEASYWSLRIDDHVVHDVAWGYMDPLPECPRIKGYLCFYPQKVDRLEVEGEGP
jgi:uncharacterized protein (DUF427 family)